MRTATTNQSPGMHGNADPRYQSIKDKLRAARPGESVRWHKPPKNPYSTVQRWAAYCGFVPIVTRRGRVVEVKRPQKEGNK